MNARYGMFARLKSLVFCATLLPIISSSAFYYARVETNSPIAAASPSPENGKPEELQQQLIEAQRDYYRAQAKKLSEPEKSFNLTSLLSISGAIAAALVALFSLYVNHRTATRTQKDTQFYEALKRFGDKDSPTVRSSAAGIIASLGRNERVLRWQRPTGWWLPIRESTHPYYETALDQLIAGLMLEENSVCLNSIRDAVNFLIPHDPSRVVAKAHQANLKLQHGVLADLAEFFATNSEDESAVIYGTDAPWNKAAAVTPYEETVIHDFTRQQNDLFEKLFHSAKQEFNTLGPAGKIEYARAALSRLKVDASRLSVDVEIYSTALRNNPFKDVQSDLSEYPNSSGTTKAPSMNLANAFLAGANLEKTQLQGVNLEGAQLQMANLTSANLQRARLCQANFQGAYLINTELQHANLAGADFTGFKRKNFDGKTLYESQTILTWANLRQADLSIASFEGADLNVAKLSGVITNDNTNMSGTNWWLADFCLEASKTVETKLLDNLYRAHKEDLPENLTKKDTHPGVWSFLEAKKKEEQEKQSGSS
jgi:uncharacterized protein YjbI with pentapeptide repeats